MSEPSIDRGSLRLNDVGRREILDSHGRALAELTSGDLVLVAVGGVLTPTRIEYEQGRGYVSVDGYL